MIYDSGSHLDNLAEKVDAAVYFLQPRKRYFDSIVVRGQSGVIVGSPVALRLRVPLVVVRKPGVSSHSSYHVINLQNVGDRWLFLDDFISSGATLLACKNELAKYDTRCSFVYQYDRPVEWPNWRLEDEDYEVKLPEPKTMAPAYISPLPLNPFDAF